MELADKLGIRGAIEFRQGVGQEELAKLYREAAVFVLSSDEEGLGMVILEAMASGVPAISTRSGGPDGIITDGVDGVLVPMGQPEALSAALRQTLQDEPRRRAMGIAARATVETRFSMRVAGDAFLRTYAQLLGQ